MVITCPSCSARYRLNPDKIKGRGAKITCPKCSHIFVVFSDQERSKPGDPVPSPPPSASSDKGPDTAGDLLAKRDKATTTGAFKAVGIDEESSPSLTASGKIRVVAPGPRKSRRKVATIDSSASLDAIRPDTADDLGPPPGAEESGEVEISIPEPNSAADLDFREVGITTWKVKVAIGLIYDFSDISTLKKYLADKKVTEDDLISHNAKDWVRIGDIENLDRHFIETWKEAKLEKLQKGSKAKARKPSSSDDAATSTGRMSASQSMASSTGSFAANPAAGGLAGSGSATARQRTVRRPRPEEKKERSVAPYALVAIVLIGIGGWFAFGRPQPPAPAEQTPAPAAGVETPGAEDNLPEDERERIRERIRRDMEEQRARLEEELGTEEITPEPELIPVQPKVNRLPQRQAGKLPPPIKSAPSARGDATPEATPAPVADSGTSTTTTVTDAGGSMWFAKAKEQYQNGNYGTAKTMANKAVSKDPSKGAYHQLLGDILTALGEPDAAAAAYAKAAELGQPASAAGP